MQAYHGHTAPAGPLAPLLPNLIKKQGEGEKETTKMKAIVAGKRDNEIPHVKPETAHPWNKGFLHAPTWAMYSF